MKKTILTAAGVLLFSLSYGQYSYRINVSGSTRSCPASMTHTISGTFNGSGTVSLPNVNSSFTSGTLFSGTYGSTFTGRLTIAGRSNCICVGDPGCSSATVSSTLNLDVTIPVPSGISLCESLFSIPNGTGSSNYTLSAHLILYKSTLSPLQLITSPVDFCLSNTYTFQSSDILSSYQWEVSKGSSGVYTTIKVTSTGNVSISLADVVAAGFSDPSGLFSFRLKNPNCPFNSLSAPIAGLEYRALAPMATVQFFDPLCSTGRGEIRVTGIIGGSPQYLLTIKKLNSDGTAYVPNVGMAITVSSIGGVFNSASGHTIEPGSYRIEVANSGNFGACSNSYDGIIVKPPPLTLSEARTHVPALEKILPSPALRDGHPYGEAVQSNGGWSNPPDGNEKTAVSGNRCVAGNG